MAVVPSIEDVIVDTLNLGAELASPRELVAIALERGTDKLTDEELDSLGEIGDLLVELDAARFQLSLARVLGGTGEEEKRISDRIDGLKAKIQQLLDAADPRGGGGLIVIAVIIAALFFLSR